MAKRHPAQNALAPLLLPLSRLYGAGMEFWRRAYAAGRLQTYHSPIPCISVGNISWGGTGKTPVIQYLLDWAATSKLRAGVLIRGYKAHPQKPPLLVTPYTPVKECGDEALMLAAQFPEAVIIVDPKRVRGARLAESLCPRPDLLLIDDGFQHLALARNINLVLLDNDDLGRESLDNPGTQGNWNRVIPAGSWREPATALKAADAFLIKSPSSRQPQISELMSDQIAKKLTEFGKPIFPFHMKIRGLRRLGATSDRANSQNEFQNIEGDYALLCAVGNPRQVEESVVAFLGRPPIWRIFLPDHHPLNGELTAQDGQKIPQNIPVICTAKDAAKLHSQAKQNFFANFFVLDAQPEFFPAINAQSIAEPSLARQSNTGQNSRKQDSPGQDFKGQDFMGQDLGQDVTGQTFTAWLQNALSPLLATQLAQSAHASNL